MSKINVVESKEIWSGIESISGQNVPIQYLAELQYEYIHKKIGFGDPNKKNPIRTRSQDFANSHPDPIQTLKLKEKKKNNKKKSQQF